MNSDFASAFHRATSINRSDIYGVPEDVQLPTNLKSDARVPFVGFAGNEAKKGGIVFLAINPGGGGDAYSFRTPQDEILIPSINSFVNSNSGNRVAAFSEMSNHYYAMAKTWNLWKILAPAISASKSTPEEITYLNCFPFRTRRDAKPHAAALRMAWQLITQPLIDDLSPSIIIALGMKAGDVAQRNIRQGAPLFVVPRTIGDSYISENAHKVLNEIRSFAGQP